MDVEISLVMPKQYAHLAPTSSYDTRLVYTGFGRYDVVRKVWIQLQEISHGLRITETPCDNPVFRRAFHTEIVHVTVYPDGIWSEEISPNEIYYYVPISNSNPSPSS
jgi:hypothetical protein